MSKSILPHCKYNSTASSTVSQQQFQPRMQITQDFIFDKLICYSYVQEYVIE